MPIPCYICESILLQLLCLLCSKNPTPIMLLSFLFSLFCLISATSSICYSLDGQELSDIFAPCKPSARYSPCCATKKTNPDICLDGTGLCYCTDGISAGTVWQEGCTDKTGIANECPRVCPGNAFL